MSLQIARATYGDPDVDALIAAHVARSRKHYPVTSCHSYSSADLAQRGVVLFIGRVGGAGVVIGGYQPLTDGAVEMKSVFAAKAARGQGHGLAMVRHLMHTARAEGYRTFQLETGSDRASAAARGVYEKLGFTYRGPFGSYTNDPLSAFMEAAL